MFKKIWICVFCLLAGSLRLSAHVKDLIVCEFRLTENKVSLTLVLPMMLLQGFDDNRDGEISSLEARNHQEMILRSLEPRIVLRDGTNQAKLTLSDLPANYVPPDLGSQPGSHGAIQVEFVFAQPVQQLKVYYDYFPLPERCVATFHRGNKVKAFTFDSNHREYEFEHPGSQFANFMFLGVNHLFTGPDHILFLLALICGSLNLLSTVKTVTAFTVSHSLTLALGALGWVQLPPSVVEPLIALSIIYTAVHNLRKQPSASLWPVAFGFGLIHGLSFASILTEVKLIGSSLLGALAGFNVGMELGQLVLVLLFAPMITGVRELQYGPGMVRLISGLTGLMAFYWLFERIRLYWF